MAPWDELPYFDLPLVTTVSLVAGAQPVSVLKSNPRRVGLIFGVSQSLASNFVQIFPTAPINGFAGMQIGGNMQPLQITQRDFGSLCTTEWSASSPTATVTLVIFEVTMNKWPNAEGSELAQVLAALKLILKTRS